MTAPIKGRRRRNLKVLRLFFGLVFGFFLQYLRGRLTGRSYDFFGDAQRNRRRAIKIRTTALEMGGVMIKVGQFLSSRVDLLPPEYIEELALLQDEVPPVPYHDIREKLEHELGGPVHALFSFFDDVPVAAASLGQVHRATLPTGEQVAVKIQRPGIAAIVEADLESFRYIVGWLNRNTQLRKKADLPLILAEFEDTLRLELDYRREGHHAERFAVAFRDIPGVVIPRIFWSHSRGDVLTLQFMTGTKITEFENLERDNISRPVVAEILMRAYLKQILLDGFFHADPHPGNVLVRPGPVVVLLDFGMVGEISPEMRDNIRRVFLGIVRRDFDDVIQALARLGFLTPNADRRAIRRALVWTVDTFYNLSFGELQSIDPAMVLNELQDVLFAESVQIPANFAFLGRALGTLSGLCTALDPSFQFVSVAEPYARDLLRSGRDMRGTVEQLVREARSLAVTAYRLPYLSSRALESVQNGGLDVRAEIGTVVEAAEELNHSVRRLLYGLLVVGFLVAGTLVFTTQHLAALIALLIAVLLMVSAFFPTRSRR
ncbi:MAG: AarF/ABC1/UbiB kinase family protein [Chloroflexota bacterium]